MGWFTPRAFRMKPQASLDDSLRLAAFSWMERLSLEHGSLLPHSELEKGIVFRGQRVPLISPRGIHIPAYFRNEGLLELALSFNTAPVSAKKPRPYEDAWGADGLLRYKYFKSDPTHRDNAGMRGAMQASKPLIYLEGIRKGLYRADWPVFIVGEDTARLEFVVSVDSDNRLLGAPNATYQNAPLLVRDYSERTVLQRNHQRTFRQRVLLAYDQACCICKLRHEPLLDAAHILSDSDPRGEPWVSNGLALCKIHHAAFDVGILGVRPTDLVVEIRDDILAEIDGPMLTHGLQALHGRATLAVPKEEHLKPRRDFLEEKYLNFRTVA